MFQSDNSGGSHEHAKTRANEKQKLHLLETVSSTSGVDSFIADLRFADAEALNHANCCKKQCWRALGYDPWRYGNPLDTPAQKFSKLPLWRRIFMRITGYEPFEEPIQGSAQVDQGRVEDGDAAKAGLPASRDASKVNGGEAKRKFQQRKETAERLSAKNRRESQLASQVFAVTRVSDVDNFPDWPVGSPFGGKI